MNRLVGIVVAHTLMLSFAGVASVGAAVRVELVLDAAMDRPAEYGVSELEKSLGERGLSVRRVTEATGSESDVLIFAGVVSNDGGAVRALRGLEVSMPEGPEALVIRHAELKGKPAIVLCGSDARGLMYAALDAADRISWSRKGTDPFVRVRDTRESPYVRERAVSIYTMQRAYFESRLYDEIYWRRYFGMLAHSRINSFVVVFGYENGGFMAPPYPYFFDMAEFPQVKLVGITAEQQQRNTAAFKRMIEIAHAHGVDFTAAIWDHIYRGGVQAGGIEGASEKAGRPTEGLVWGVTTENLAAYNKTAIRRFLEVFPEIDGLQFRMHGESGLKGDEMKGFWHEVFGMVHQMRPEMRVDLRAKELPDEIIEDGLDQGLPVRVTTKYWMEQMGLPFHPTHVNRQNQRDRRHGYADLLRYPQRYKVHWRLWNGGTTRLLLWGDPEYVRRFAESARLYDGDSFEVNEMLATWMLGEPHEAKPLPLLNPKYRYYDYEFERYWHYYQVWGRVGYNPQTPAEVWGREFDRRFGPQAGPALMKGLHLASNILPRIVAASYRYQLFPTTRGWAEMMRIDDLPQYADAEGSDIQQFLSMRDHAKSLIEGTDTAMRRPAETSRWFLETSNQVLEQVAQAEKSVGNKRSREFISTITDLKILAGLAQYHSHRLPAGVSYNLYKQTGDLAAFDEALGHERQAVAAWARVVDAASDVYSHDLALGVHRVGFPRHWEEELQKLKSGLERLEESRQKAQPRAAGSAPIPARRHTPDETQPPQVDLERVRSALPGQNVTVTARVQDSSGIKWARLRYRHITQFEDYQTEEMKCDPETGLWSATIPGAFVVPPWDLMYFVEAVDTQGNGRMYPDMDVETPYVIVELGR